MGDGDLSKSKEKEAMAGMERAVLAAYIMKQEQKTCSRGGIGITYRLHTMTLYTFTSRTQLEIGVHAIRR